ncbi:MAG: DedA family protein [Bdellovibrionales bacterium]|nr:DedA family protein [Bdellovibrionales bacterium]
MIDLSQDALLRFFSEFAYDPVTVYSVLVGLMVASSFGFPVPEEVTLISVGLVAYLAKHPELYPPPEPGMKPIDPHTLAAVAFGAVFLSDLLVYSVGRHFGRRALRIRFVRRLINPRVMRKIERWSHKYGAFAAGIFRFTPGLRFPGHLMCGVTKLSLPKFVMTDGAAALISVPTQVLFLAYYGDQILGTLKQVKISILGVLILGALFFFINRYRRNLKKTSGP